MQPVAAQITVVSTSVTPPPTSSAVSTLTLDAPSGIVANNVLIAVVAIRGGSSVSISSAPAGWALVNRTDSTTRVAQAVYLHVVAGSEPASYTWNFTPSDRAAGAIMALRGVSTTTAIDASGGQATTSDSTSINAPSISTTVANTMLIGAFSVDQGNDSFLPPTGMTEHVDHGTGAGPNGITLALAAATFAGTGTTGPATAAYTSPQRGVGTLIALRPGAATPSAPGGFNVFETSTPSSAISGAIRTKIAGLAFSLAVVALNPARTAVLTDFTGSVVIELLDGSDNGGALDPATGCRSSWTTIQTVSPNPAFTTGDGGRINVGVMVANAWRDVRVRVTYTGTGTVVGCSTDNFAIRPSSFASLQALDANDSTAGLVRTLNNVSPTSGVVHRAGRPFSVLAQAVSATGAATSGYNGAPSLDASSCIQPVGCSVGVLTSSLVGSGGAVTGTATHEEAGVIGVTLQDSSFAAVDAGDSSPAERTISSSALTIGRFVPDAYRLTIAAAPQFVAPLCAAGPARQAFNLVGQPFSFGTVPVVLATPLNAAGTALANARPHYVAAHVSNTVSAAGAPVALAGTAGVAGIAHSATSTITFDAGSFAFTRGAPVSSFVPTLSMTVNLADPTENGTSGNSTINALAPLTMTPIDFAAAAGTFHYGRAQLRPTYGDVRRELYVPLEVQRFNGFGWVALPEAGNCLVAPATTFAYSNATGLLDGGGGVPNCASRVAAAVVTANGRAAIRLDKPGSVTTTAASAMTMTLNLLAAAVGTSCNGAAPTAATTVNAPWLANAGGTNPSARLTWGRMRGELLGLRERFD